MKRHKDYLKIIKQQVVTKFSNKFLLKLPPLLLVGAVLLFWMIQTTQPVKASEENDSERVRIIAMGDNLIHSSVYDAADAVDGTIDGQYDFKPFYRLIKPKIAEADVAFVNQETIVGGKELGLSSYPMFNSPEEVATALKDTGFDVINGATNHSLDKLDQGVINAIDNFQKVGLPLIGVNKTAADQDKVTIIEKNGLKIAFLAYTYGTNGMVANDNYRVNYLDQDLIKKQVEIAKKEADAVVVSAHWGTEDSTEADDDQKTWAKFFADQGVDAVIGTHPHVIQPIEWVEGTEGHKTLVAYSIGNGLNGMQDVDNVLGGLLNFTIHKDGDSIVVDSVTMDPIMTHYQTVKTPKIDQEARDKNAPNAFSSDHHYEFLIYPLSRYTNQLAEKHFIHQEFDQTITKEILDVRFTQLFDQQFWPRNYRYFHRTEETNEKVRTLRDTQKQTLINEQQSGAN